MRKISHARLNIDDIAIGDHRTLHRLDSEFHAIRMHRGLIPLKHSASMNREAVDAVLAKNFQQGRKLIGTRITDTRLDRESAGNGIAQGTDDFIDCCGLAQQTAAGILAAHDRRRAAKVEVNARHRQLRQFAGRTHEAVDIAADHLRENWSASRIFHDRPLDVWVQL